MTLQPKQTLQSRSEQTLQRILDACDVLISQKPFEQISMQEIAKTAGVSVGNLYNRFEDKNALVDYVLVSHQQRVVDELADELARRPAKVTVAERCREVAVAIAGSIASLGPIYATMAARQARGADVSDLVRSNSNAVVDAMTAWIVEDRSDLDEERCRFAVATMAFTLQYNVMFGTPDRLFGSQLTELLSRQAYAYIIADAGEPTSNSANSRPE